MVAYRKYKNTVTYLDGEKFDSAWEATCWSSLKLMERAGSITDLRRQVRMPLRADNGSVVCFLVPDFAYRDDKGRQVYADAKGYADPVWTLKAKWFHAQEGQPVVLMRREKRAARLTFQDVRP